MAQTKLRPEQIKVEIQEDDGKVADAHVVNFEGGGGKVTDEGAGKVTVDITPGGDGGGTVEIQEDDVKVADADTVNFEGGGGKVVDEGGGKVTVDITPGGGGGPADAKYIVTEAHDDLSEEIVLPQLAQYDPDTPPASPSSYDDEFEDDAVDVKWTFFASAGVPTENDNFDHLIATATPEYSEAKFKGFMALKPVKAAGGTLGMRESFAPSSGTAFTVTTKIALSSLDGVDQVRIIISNEQPTGGDIQTNDCVLIILQQVDATRTVKLRAILRNNGASAIDASSPVGPHNGFIYIKVSRRTDNSLWVSYSFNGIVWAHLISNATGYDINTLINYLWFVAYDAASNNPPPIGLINFVRVIEGAATDKIGKDV